MFMFNFITSLATYGLVLSLFVTTDDAMANQVRPAIATDVAISAVSLNTSASRIKPGELVETQSSVAQETRKGLERARIAFNAQLALDCTSDAQLAWVADDAVYQYALSGVDVTARIDGHSSIAKHLCALSDIAPQATAEEIRYFPTLFPNIVYVQYQVVPANKSAESHRALAIIELSGEQITKFTQLNRSPNSLKVIAASL